MNIERILRDIGGTKPRLGATEYHFKPLWDDGPHVAFVEDEQHQRVFLSIPEGYRPYDGVIPEAGAAPVLAPVVKAPAAPAPEPVAAPVAAVEPNAGATAPVERSEDDLAAFEDKELTDAEDAALRALFKSEIGRAAPPKSKPETMIAQIRAKREAGATE